MLNQHEHEHLSRDELLQALVDVADLTVERQSHLVQCADCQKGLERLQQGFERLQGRARQMAPAPLKHFRLAEKATVRTWWRFKPMWAAGAVAAIVLAAVLWWPRQFESPARVPNVALQNPPARDALLDQVDDLIDNPLPPVLQQLAATSDPEDTHSVIDWVVPPIDEMEDDDSWT